MVELTERRVASNSCTQEARKRMNDAGLFPIFPSGYHYCPHMDIHIGDKWSRLNWAIRLLQSGGVPLVNDMPFLPKEGRIISRILARKARMAKGVPFVLVFHKEDTTSQQIIELLDFGDFKPPIYISPYYTRIRRLIDCPSSYQVPYYPTKIRYNPIGNLIACSFASNWNREAKTPHDLYANFWQLKKTLPEYNFVSITKATHPTITSVVDTLSQASLLLAVDNGICHIARSVGVPMFIIEHKWPLERGFPTTVCQYTKVSSDNLIAPIWDFLRPF